MASRPRPSLLALFDPLSNADASPSTPTRNAFSSDPSPDSGSDKENLISTTPKGSLSRAYRNGGSDIQHVHGSGSNELRDIGKGNGPHLDLLGESFSFEPKVDDSSHLCLVQLADELATACKIVDSEDIIQGAGRPREPLSEIYPALTNGRTPQNVARDKGLIRLDTPSTTPSSLRKFAAGIKKGEISTPVVSSPLPAPGGTPRNISPELRSSSDLRQVLPNATTPASVHPYPAIPLARNSPQLLCLSPASDLNAVFSDPPPCHVGSSFEIRNSKIIFSGDLLTDDLSFLERLEDDSLAEVGRANDSSRTNGSSPSTLEVDRTDDRLMQNSCISNNLRRDALDKQHIGLKPESPVRKLSAFRRSSSHSGLTFVAIREEPSTGLSSPTRLEPRTPSSSPLASRLGGRERVLAPKKGQAVLRKSNTLTRSTSARAIGTFKEQPEDEAASLRPAESGPVRPRPSSLEIKSFMKSQTPAVRKIDPVTIKNDAPILARRASVSRPSVGRRASVGRALSPVKPKAPVPVPIPSQDEVPKRPATSLAKSARRLSVSTSSKPALIKTNNFATTGRVGGARRVPLTTNAQLYKPNDVIVNEAKSPKPIPRAATIHARTGPQRPPIPNVSNTLGRSSSGPKVASRDKASSANLAASKSRTLGRTMSTSNSVFTRSTFMTSSSSSMVTTSRLPLPPSKSTSRIPGPGARKAFR